MIVIELSHPSDPRYLLIFGEPPERISPEEVGSWQYGKPLLFPPGPVTHAYAQPDGAGTDWIRPN